MATVMIKCPTTGKDVSTGMSMDQQSFQTATLSNNSVRCSACGKDHVWNKKDAFLK